MIPPQSVVAILDQNTVVKPGFWTANPPPGTAGGLHGYVGQVAIPAGADSVDVVFSSALADVPLTPFCSIQRPAGATTKVSFVDCTNVSVNGFSANFGGSVPVSGYLLSFVVVTQVFPDSSGSVPMGGSAI